MLFFLVSLRELKSDYFLRKKMEGLVYLSEEEKFMAQYIFNAENWMYFDGQEDEEKYNIRKDDIYLFLYNVKKDKHAFWRFAKKLGMDLLYFEENSIVVVSFRAEKHKEGTFASHVYSRLKKGANDEVYLEFKRLVECFKGDSSWKKDSNKHYLYFPDPRFDKSAYIGMTARIQGLRFLRFSQSETFAEFEYSERW